MGLGPGYYDAKKIWRYGEDDSNPLNSDLLNRGQESVSDATVFLAGTPAERVALAPAPPGAYWKDTDATAALWAAKAGAWELQQRATAAPFTAVNSPAPASLVVVRQKAEIVGDFITFSAALTGTFSNNLYIGYIGADFRPFGTEVYPVVSTSAGTPSAANLRVRGKSDPSNPGELWYWGPAATALHINILMRWR